MERRRAEATTYAPQTEPLGVEVPVESITPALMLTEGKAKSILTHLHPGEPVFVFRAKDILSVFALEAYAELIEKYDGNSPQALSLSDAIHDFRVWQKNNPALVKLPD